jgi:hypothetical protein
MAIIVGPFLERWRLRDIALPLAGAVHAKLQRQ